MNQQQRAEIQKALEALEDFADVIKYDNEQDDIGRRACCDELSYKQHSENCKTVQSITALRQMLEQPVQEAWVGLTDEEVMAEAAQEEQAYGFIQGVRWADAKLREKNVGAA